MRKKEEDKHFGAHSWVCANKKSAAQKKKKCGQQKVGLALFAQGISRRQKEPAEDSLASEKKRRLSKHTEKSRNIINIPGCQTWPKNDPESERIEPKT